MPNSNPVPEAQWQAAFRGDFRSIARGITLVENEGPGHERLLKSLPGGLRHRVIGITGPPGAGKSTLVDGLIGQLTKAGNKVAVLCVDPSSPFNLGALLGDRIRMSQWYNDPNVFIRSLASRGSLGGLHPAILEITSFLSACPFDYVIIETVGVGQSEVEIAGLADVTVVVVVPEAGDEIQTMKAGLMEVADIFVVNKSDRPGADSFVKNLHYVMRPAADGAQEHLPVIKTIASRNEGLPALHAAIVSVLHSGQRSGRQLFLLAERAYHLIQKKRMKDIQKEELRSSIALLIDRGDFNLYSFIEKF